jgi:predicted RNA-binding protein YlxR (DUF448 family)
MRRCVGCGRSRPKAELDRFVRSPGGALEADPEARRPGRGAYLCPEGECGAPAVHRKGFERSLRAPVSTHLIDSGSQWRRSAFTR